MGLAAPPWKGDRLRQSFRGRRIASVLAFVLVATVLSWIGWTRGRYEPATFRIAGPSMAPTLIGEHFVGMCLACGERKIALDASNQEPLPTEVPCFLCGSVLTIDSESIADGDTVLVSPLRLGQTIRIGQLVAIESTDGSPLRVKRVVAVGGQTIDHRSDRLMVDGQRVGDLLRRIDEDAVPRMIVADESMRLDDSRSRWIPVDEDDPAWRFDDRVWSLVHPDKSDWLVYHHRNVHQGGIAGPVLDDYEYNPALIRRLYDADRLRVDVNIQVNQAGRVDVAFWKPTGIAIASKNVRAISGSESLSSIHFSIDQADTIIEPIDAPQVTRETPVAIRIEPLIQDAGIQDAGIQDAGIQDPAIRGIGNPSFSASLRDLRISKYVTYRLRRNDDRSRYPITLRDGEFFVLGDNVPVSIDSRSGGPITREKIVGVVTRE